MVVEVLQNETISGGRRNGGRKGVGSAVLSVQERRIGGA